MESFKLCEEIENIRVWNPKVWSLILMGIQNFFFVPRLWQDEKPLSLVFNVFYM